MSDDRGPSRAKQGMSIVGLIMMIVFIIYVGQIYLNPPANRPVVACWLPYQIGRVIGVEGSKLLLWKDPEITLAAATKMANFNGYCICTVAKASWLTKGESPNIPYTCRSPASNS